MERLEQNSFIFDLLLCRVSSQSAARVVGALPEKSSVPLAFFGPYREELLQRFGLDHRQFSFRKLPLDLASPTRRSLDVGDLDEPMARIQKWAPFLLNWVFTGESLPSFLPCTITTQDPSMHLELQFSSSLSNIDILGMGFCTCTTLIFIYRK